jgi:hypothetical protein
MTLCLRTASSFLAVFGEVTQSSFAEVHRFEPKVFYNTFSGAHPPALRLKPGDRVITYTIDAGGVDSAGMQRGKDRIRRSGRCISKALSRAIHSLCICCAWRHGSKIGG